MRYVIVLIGALAAFVALSLWQNAARETVRGSPGAEASNPPSASAVSERDADDVAPVVAFVGTAPPAPVAEAQERRQVDLPVVAYETLHLSLASALTAEGRQVETFRRNDERLIAYDDRFNYVGLRVGDEILSINGLPISALTSTGTIGSAMASGSLVFRVNRDGADFDLQVSRTPEG